MTSCLLAAGPALAHGSVAEQQLLLPDVPWDDVTVDTHVIRWTRHRPGRHRCRSALLVHGFAHTAATWRAFALATLEWHGQRPCHMWAIDLPGHGQSALPPSGGFQQLSLNAYAGGLVATAQRLRAQGYDISRLVAHSQGALVVQMAQQALLDGKNSLRKAAGVREVVLLAPAPPRDVGWDFADSGSAADVIADLVAVNPELGTHVAIPDAMFPFLFFRDLQGNVIPEAPTPEEIAAGGFNAPEPFLSAGQLIGSPLAGPRPHVAAGAFASPHRTRLLVVAFEQDTVVLAGEAEETAVHLRGRRGNSVCITGGDAIHDAYKTSPGVVARVANWVRFAR